MIMKYLQCDENHKLFSWYRHDYKETTINGIYYMLDGGLSGGEFFYYRKSETGKIRENEIKDIIIDIRNSYIWGKSTNEKGEILSKTEYILLKDLDSSHIFSIISYLNNREYNKVLSYLVNNKYIINNVNTINFYITLEIFIQELNYRFKNNLK